MIRIAITQAAYDAICATLPLGSVGYEPELNAKGEMHIWIDQRQADKLAAMRGPGESYSDAILRIVDATESGTEGACAPYALGLEAVLQGGDVLLGLIGPLRRPRLPPA
jgi:hypothetical protein